MTKVYTEKEAKMISDGCYDLYVNHIRLISDDTIMIPKSFGKISIENSYTKRKTKIYIRQPKENYLKWLRKFHDALKFVFNAQNIKIRYE